MSDTVEDLKKRIALYEQNGPAKAAYSINRKLNELADMLNKTDVSNLDLSDAKDKSFERLKVAWNEMKSLGEAYHALAESAGITGDKEKDISKKPFTDRLASERT